MRFAGVKNRPALSEPSAWNNPMNSVVPPCPICSESIVFGSGNIERSCVHAAKSVSLLLSSSTHSTLQGRLWGFNHAVRFCCAKDIGLGAAAETPEKHGAVFELIVTHEAPGASYSEAQLLAYLTSLVEGQRTSSTVSCVIHGLSCRGRRGRGLAR